MVAAEFTTALRAKYGVEFKDLSLLDAAFTHASFANENKELGYGNYERLEFLGDAVMELAVSDYLFENYQHLPEGKLTRMRAAIVKSSSFCNLALEAGFKPYINLGVGEERMGSRERPSLLEDVWEAFNGALYLDQGMPAVVAFLKQILFPKIDAGQYSSDVDFKTRLQEYLQRDGERQIEYVVLDTVGDENDKQFIVELQVDGQLVTKGEGKNKKTAEKAAAKSALLKYHVINEE
ncbi:ribonuclease III [Lapidilactobacillus gannanensis]|jgi:ribonuclease-3|uniref:Ribonuclease 3 n=1 Tax=Lapidilactobacillus gannanensis TaxID=2486002 RepID=A0ABW4BNY6_9LACO|nr:ribonuclease III [Lapidilactobacillus gannanensis]MCH4058077.1 ribonuclease III [Lactobacillaceae bacterium]